MPFASNAEILTVRWINPTQNEDGTPLPVAAISRTNIQWGTCNGTAFGTQQGSVNAPGPATSVQTPDLPPGTYCIRALTEANGAWSAYSNVVRKIVAATPPPIATRPNPPQLLAI